MRVLLVQPRVPVTYWGFQYAISIAGRAVNLPPLGLITVAALLPESWSLRLVDLNGESLDRADLFWADVVFTGGMRVQAESMREVVTQARAAGRPVVVGGSAVSTDPDLMPDADVVFMGEAEGRERELVDAVEDVVCRYSPSRTDASTEPVRLMPNPDQYPSMEKASVPRFDLLKRDLYISMAVQYSRGCPFSCEFCDVVSIFGSRSRVKPVERVLAELDDLYEAGYRGTLFFVDDNFIGNRKEVRKLLPKLAAWQKKRNYPFELYTEASVDLASDEELMEEMVWSGFTSVFLGIETPSTAALESAGKRQNLKLDLAVAVERITQQGMEVMGGFIVGFDSDRPEVFKLQREFIGSLPMPLAMVGILTAMPGTPLWRRLGKEGRLRDSQTGDQFCRPNFKPRMDERALLSGYAALMSDLYSPISYYERCHAYLERTPPPVAARTVRPGGYKVLLRSMWRIGLLGQARRYYWRLLFAAIRRGRTSLSWAVGKAIQGEHFIRYTRQEVLPRLRQEMERMAREASAKGVAPGHVSARAGLPPGE